MEFLNTVAESFYIPADEYKRMKDYILFSFDQLPDDEEIMVIDGKEDSEYEKIKMTN